MATKTLFVKRTALVGLFLLLVGSTAVFAQARWQQTAQVITPIQQDEVTGALLESLIGVIASEQAGLTVKRVADDAENATPGVLQERLFDEGYDFWSANQVFITYRFESTQQGFNTEITDLFFIYRPEYEGDVDTPLLYVDATQPAMQNLLVNQGVGVLGNEAVFKPFIDELAFHHLQESTLVNIGGRTIRDVAAADVEKRRLLNTMRKLMY